MTLSKRATAVFLLGAFGLSACGGGASTSSVQSTQSTSSAAQQTTTTTSAPPKPIGGGKAGCTNADIQKVLDGVANGQPATLINATCKQGWMVMLASVNGPDSPPTTFVFQAEGPFWALQNRSKVCMPPSPVPKSLQQTACHVN